MYVVIERFGHITLLKDLDGEVMVFDNFEEASERAQSECHDGLVVNLGKRLIFK